MILLLHIAIALTGLVVTGLAFFSPSKSRIRFSQLLIVATLTSGTYLVISTKADMVHACAMGLIYTAIVSFGIVGANRKLVSETSQK